MTTIKAVQESEAPCGTTVYFLMPNAQFPIPNS
jgi:hypothetical protein